MQVLYSEIGNQRKFIEMQMFNKACNNAWSKTGEIFPMQDASGQLYECSFNANSGLIVAYSKISVQEFRQRLVSAAEKIYSERMKEAAIKASEEVAAIYEIALRGL